MNDTNCDIVFEDNSLNERTVQAVEKQIHYGDSNEKDEHKEGRPVTESKEIV